MTQGYYLSEDHARTVLSPHHQQLRTFVLTAWQEWQGVCEAIPNFRSTMSKRARANVVYDFIASPVRRHFHGKNVAVTEARKFVEAYIDGVICLRFKKVNDSYMSANYPTQTQVLYYRQMPLFSGDTLLGKRLTVGYRLTSDATAIADVCIIYREGKQIVWAYSIPAQDEEQLGGGVSLPPAEPIVPSKITLKRPKDESERKEETA